MEKTKFVKKLELLSEEKWDLTSKTVKSYAKGRKEFTRSLELFKQVDCSYLQTANEIDKLIQLFIEIVSIEMLVRDNYGRPKEDFSIRGAWLLATSEEQLDVIQTHLGTLYNLRNFITHSLFLPSKDRNFKRYFKTNIDKALLAANSYHRVVLLRLIDKKKGILDKKTLIKKLLGVRLKLNLDITESFYEDLISRILTEVTEKKSMKRKEFRIYLPKEVVSFYWAINSYGGIVKPVHIITGQETLFYENNVAIIPEICISPSTNIISAFGISSRSCSLYFLEKKMYSWFDDPLSPIGS